jgi:biuret amidohydrolase
MSTLTIDARPYPYTFDPARTAIVMIDMQRDFIEPGGFGDMLGNDVSRLSKIVPACVALLDLCRSQGIRVIHTQEAHAADLSDCPPSKLARGNLDCGIGDPGPMGRVLVEGEPGAGFVPELLPQKGDIVLRKPGKGAFCATGMDHILHTLGITHLLFAGVTTEVCVQTSMREANDRGYECLIVEDCTESYFEEFKRVAIEMLIAQGGIIGWAAPLAALQAALLLKKAAA